MRAAGWGHMQLAYPAGPHIAVSCVQLGQMLCKLVLQDPQVICAAPLSAFCLRLKNLAHHKS
jgi:hypothetical protein